VLEKFGGLDSLVSKDIAEPEPKAEHVVIQIKALGINHAEMHTCDLDPIPDFNPLHAEADVRCLAIPAEEHVLRRPLAHNRT
jgi:NADPH:quinone reductase-like Zn-dependent oxidoreductase